MIVSRSTDRSAPAIEPATLAHLLTMGDDALRLALCAQLQADFSRLRGAVAVHDGQQAGRAAHELKGLAGTVGALRLAELARRFDAMGPDLAADARAVLVAALHLEIDAVQQVLAEAGAGDFSAE